MQLRTFNLGLGLKFFRKGTLAPIGKYNKLELLLLLTKLTYGDNSFISTEYNYGTTTRISKGTGNYNFTTFGVVYTTGRSRVLFNKLVLDYGLRLGVVPPGILAFFLGDIGDGGQGQFESTLNRQVNFRLFREQLVNFHIGLGFLAF